MEKLMNYIEDYDPVLHIPIYFMAFNTVWTWIASEVTGNCSQVDRVSNLHGYKDVVYLLKLFPIVVVAITALELPTDYLHLLLRLGSVAPMGTKGYSRVGFKSPSCTHGNFTSMYFILFLANFEKKISLMTRLDYLDNTVRLRCALPIDGPPKAVAPRIISQKGYPIWRVMSNRWPSIPDHYHFFMNTLAKNSTMLTIATG